jgi:uncharacterized hydrophobic protein (TIGR00271 family)
MTMVAGRRPMIRHHAGVARRRHLSSADRARVADRVGWQASAPGESPTDFVDTTSIVESLDTASLDAASLEKPVFRADLDHWTYTPTERVRVLQTLMLSDGAPWVARFGFLLAMSVLIATLGLANDQTAAVIAAMVIAPLMTPVLGLACSTTLGLARQTFRLTVIVIVASMFAVAFGWAISATLVIHELTAEELSRTAPRLRDLTIALAAGSAGMYSVVRKDLSGVVPGVAIAVALVPPLATIGIVLELHEWSLARGAALLYTMNVLAIIVAAIVVLLVTDFMQSPPLRDPKVAFSGAAILAVSVAIVIPIWLNSRDLDRETRFAHHAAAEVLGWDLAHPSHRVIEQQIEPGAVSLVIAGSTEPPALTELQAAIANDDFPTPTFEVQWASSSLVEIDPEG